MTFYYTARSTFDKYYDEDALFWKRYPGTSWEQYLVWSKLVHLVEVVSLDIILNEPIIEPDYDKPDDWEYIVTDGDFITHFFTSIDYVLQKAMSRKRFNLLAVVTEPTHDCKNVKLQNFEFVGYDLLDKSYGTSALTNCGGLNETFLPSDLNELGLIDDYEKAYDVKRRLLKNNPQCHHADTNVIAI